MSTCPTCGKENLERAKYCGYCGSALIPSVPVQPPPDWISDKTVKASPIFFQEQAKKRPTAQPKGWVWSAAVLLIAVCVLAAAVFTGTIPLSFLPSSPPLAGLSALWATPTSTSTLTATALPTSTQTPTPRPTLAPPTPTPTLALAGIGVNRNTLQAAYANLGFAFHETSPVNQQPRYIGRSIDSTCSIELVGSSQELVKASLFIGASNVGNQDVVAAVYLERFLKLATPDWEEANAWLRASQRELAQSSQNTPQITTTAGNNIVIFSLNKALELTILSVQGVPTQANGAEPVP